MSLQLSRVSTVAVVCAAVLLSACADSAPPPTDPSDVIPATGLSFAKSGNEPVVNPAVVQQLTNLMKSMNTTLLTEGTNYRVMMAEYITSGEQAEMGAVVLQKDLGNKQLAFDFVAGDLRRAWSGPGATGITYAIDQTGDAVPVFGGLTAPVTDAATVRAMGTWNAVGCSTLGISRNSDFGIDIGVVAFLNGLGGSPFVFADVQHAGFRDINFAGGVIGATFTFGFTDANGFTDIDGNGKLDAAFREIYYDPSFPWTDDPTNNAAIDLETVVLHEVGHGLSQAHFGNLFAKKGFLSASPRAVMNAFYGGALRSLLGTDHGGHCSLWANWPVK